MNYYNELDPYVAQWLRNLIAKGLIPDGKVDTHDIRKVEAKEVRNYTQAHFFAGIAGWSYALQLAGWPEDKEVWTGSCPCQPFSIAGKGKGKKDKRHLWPVWRELIAECRPTVCFGEQVGSPLGRDWLAGVRSDLEALGYEVGCADLCAAGVGAPHIRQRLFWVADAERNAGESRRLAIESRKSVGATQAGTYVESGRCSNIGGMDNATSKRTLKQETSKPKSDGKNDGVSRSSSARGLGLGNTSGERGRGNSRAVLGTKTTRKGTRGKARSKPDQPVSSGFWSNFDLVQCADGKARRIEPGVSPLAHGVPARVGKLRAYGNAIVPILAAEFIMAYLETRGITECSTT